MKGVTSGELRAFRLVGVSSKVNPLHNMICFANNENAFFFDMIISSSEDPEYCATGAASTENCTALRLLGAVFKRETGKLADCSSEVVPYGFSRASRCDHVSVGDIHCLPIAAASIMYITHRRVFSAITGDQLWLCNILFSLILDLVAIHLCFAKYFSQDCRTMK